MQYTYINRIKNSHSHNDHKKNRNIFDKIKCPVERKERERKRENRRNKELSNLDRDFL